MPGRSRDRSFDNDPEWKDFAQRALDNLVPQMDDSAFCVSIVPRKPENYDDIKWCIELGMMIMLDKPIIAVVHPGTEVPSKLVLVADAIIEMDLGDPRMSERMLEEINRTIERLEAGNGHSNGQKGSTPGEDADQPG